MRTGRTKAILCEVMIVVLFLSLSCVTILRLFSAAHQISTDSLRSSQGMLLAQDALERLVAGEALPERETRSMGGMEYIVAVELASQKTEAGALEQYAVSVLLPELGKEEVVAQLSTAWYRAEEDV